MSYGGFWKRFAALIIDDIILEIVLNLVGIGIMGGSVLSVRSGDVASGRWLVRRVVYRRAVALLQPAGIVRAAGDRRQDGVRIVVTDLDGRRISFGRATGRYFGKIVSAFIMMIGYLMAAFTQKKQALHDLIAGTLVVNKWSV